MENKVGRVQLDTWGDAAIFTRPEFKVERYSYDILTPSAARNILQQIYWHPTFQYQIRKITVFNEIQRQVITRNELDTVLNASVALRLLQGVEEGEDSLPAISVLPTDTRQQRSTSFLRDVYYRIEAEVLPSAIKPENGDTFDLNKILAIFNRRAKKGQCFAQPYFGIKEYTAFFAPSRYETEISSFYEGKTIDMGYMLFDSDYTINDNIRPNFYHAVMKDGVIEVPTQREVMGNAAFCAS